MAKLNWECRNWIWLLLPLALLAGCGVRVGGSDQGPCADGGSSCAAAEAPLGMRQVRKGHRFVRAQWVEKTNKESGSPDIGIKAQWAPITERR
jgi:hypothetical protein